MNQVFAAAQTIADDLAIVAESFLPIMISEADGDPQNQLQWMPVRTAATLRSVFILGQSGNHEDSAALVRVMADHLIMFAWLLADPKPPSRLNAWKNDDLRMTSTLRGHLEKFGVEIDPPLQPVESSVKVVSTEAAASQCDEFWEEHLTPFLRRGTAQSFAGLYAMVFRGTSPYIHPSLRGSLGFFTTPTSNPGKVFRIAKSFADFPITYANAISVQLLATWLQVARFRHSDVDKVAPFFGRVAELSEVIAGASAA